MPPVVGSFWCLDLGPRVSSLLDDLVEAGGPLAGQEKDAETGEADRDISRLLLVQLLHYCALIGRELHSNKLFS